MNTIETSQTAPSKNLTLKPSMTLDKILQDLHALEEDLWMYERKYGVRSETFYQSYMQGDEPPDDAWVKDWNGWAATYEIWLRRQMQYSKAIESLQKQTPLIHLIRRTARHESIPIFA
jgi:hypothetical protein